MPDRWRRTHIALAAILLLGGVLRLTGLDWGTETETGEFRPFHPDEVTLIANARWVSEDVRKTTTAYGHLPAYLLWSINRTLSPVLEYTPYGSGERRSSNDLRRSQGRLGAGRCPHDLGGLPVGYPTRQHTHGPGSRGDLALTPATFSSAITTPSMFRSRYSRPSACWPF